MLLFRPALAIAAALCCAALAGAGPRDFPLVQSGCAASFAVDAHDFKVVQIAAHDLATDIERITGLRPASQTNPGGLTGAVVLIGTLGHSPAIDAMVASGKLDSTDLRNRWETFLIATVENPLPGVADGLVIVGSDRRGTAFGVYELSQMIGVSPWHWWADVAPGKKSELLIPAGTRRFGPPSVRYRGIFLNDEDWGLQPWAAHTFEPENGGIGPKTYERIFELLLRLKANTLWPAMHACTKPFNADPRNARLADDYAIVMGSSHAEPMLRNNVGEWTAPKENYNYITNGAGVRDYWAERVRTNGRFENIYTLGMRGIHDSAIQGAKTDAERIRVLEQIFADQRTLLAKEVGPKIEQIPQMFCAYKEVLDLYRQGLQVPDDVTIVWPDDNFGYVRTFATPAERQRAGGFGVYYHISYLGRPLSYLWLNTTPPALLWEELTKSYVYGADRIWIVNVGDLKPAEIGTEFFLQLGWDINRWRPDNLPDFLPMWAAREFGPAHATEIAAIMDRYYRLNFPRKPEHLQWWLPGEPPRPSPFTPAERTTRLQDWTRLRAQVLALEEQIPAALHDAWFELVAYPVHSAALANARYFLGEAGSPAATECDAELRQLTRRYNEAIANGKWRGLMNLEPADNDWRSMRIAPWKQPVFSAPSSSLAKATPTLSIEAAHFSRKTDRRYAAWTVIRGLGHAGEAITVLPATAPSISPAETASDAPRLEYDLPFPSAGVFTVNFCLIPSHPLIPNRGLRFAFALDDSPPQEIVLDPADGSPDWAQGVLNGTIVGKARLTVPLSGPHCLKVFMIDAGVLLDKIVIEGSDTAPAAPVRP